MSLPDLLVRLRRHTRCRITYRDLDWHEHTQWLDDDLSEFLQHECDHLDGILAVAHAVGPQAFALRSQRPFHTQPWQAMKYTITGEIAQNVRLDLDPGETFWASNGSLMAYSTGVHWRLRIPGGVGGALRRSLAGEGLALTFVETKAAGQHVLLAANAPGHIATWDLADGPVVTTRGAFLAAWGDDVDITVTIARRAGAALFGGAGLFLQRVAGSGTVLIHGSGDFYERQLATGEQLLVSTGNLAAFSDGVDYDIQGVGGFRNILFSREGFFMTRLSGPGRVLLQTLKRKGGGKG